MRHQNLSAHFLLMNLEFLQLLLSGVKTVLLTILSHPGKPGVVTFFISAQQHAVKWSKQPCLVQGQGEQLQHWERPASSQPSRPCQPQHFPRADSLWSRLNLPRPASYLLSSIYVLTIINLYFSLEEEEIKVATFIILPIV